MAFVPGEPLARAAEPIEFRRGELQWSIFGLGGFGENVEHVTEDRFETTSRTINETTVSFIPATIVSDEPVIADTVVFYQLVTRTALVRVETPTQRRIAEKQKIRSSKEVTSIEGFGGPGIEAKYFLTRNFGLGLSGEWTSRSGDVGNLKATVTARFPMGSNAPYVYGGAGAMFANEAKAVGVLGIGLEH